MVLSAALELVHHVCLRQQDVAVIGALHSCIGRLHTNAMAADDICVALQATLPPAQVIGSAF